MKLTSYLILPATTLSLAAGTVLDSRVLLERQDFWVNQDFEWFEKNIPFFDCPDEEINTTYYYRWELVTRHFV